MLRSCTDARIDGFPTATAEGWLYGRHSGSTYYAFGRTIVMGSSYLELRRVINGSITQLSSYLLGGSIERPAALTCEGTAITGMWQSTNYGVTDSAIQSAGDWSAQLAMSETAFECYDAPAPSGPAHRVIGSGIVNSLAIVRGAA